MVLTKCLSWRLGTSLDETQRHRDTETQTHKAGSCGTSNTSEVFSGPIDFLARRVII